MWEGLRTVSASFNFTKEVPLHKLSENIKILLKLEKNVQKRRGTIGVLKHLTFSVIFKKSISPYGI